MTVGTGKPLPLSRAASPRALELLKREMRRRGIVTLQELMRLSGVSDTTLTRLFAGQPVRAATWNAIIRTLEHLPVVESELSSLLDREGDHG